VGLKKRIESRNFKDERLVGLLGELSRSKTAFWKALAKKLSTPSSRRAAVNVSKLERIGTGFTLVVPGKVLGTGTVSKKLSVAAYAFSQQAVDKLESSGGKIMSLEELFRANPTAKKLKMVI
jgi:large subunit ribosomal protein L18e